MSSVLGPPNDRIWAKPRVITSMPRHGPLESRPFFSMELAVTTRGPSRSAVAPVAQFRMSATAEVGSANLTDRLQSEVPMRDANEEHHATIPRRRTKWRTKVR